MITTNRVDLKVRYAKENEAKKPGARWDPLQQIRYVPAGLPLDQFDRWLPATAQVPGEADKGADDGVSLSAFLKRVPEVVQCGLADANWVRIEIREIRDKGGNWYLAVE
jgi:hypothetical protein